MIAQYCTEIELHGTDVSTEETPLPGAVLLMSEEQQKAHNRRRLIASRTVIAITLLFAVCYLPLHVLNTLRNFAHLDLSGAWSLFPVIAHLLCYVQCAANPIIYNYSNGQCVCVCFVKARAGRGLGVAP